jgi:cyclopropane fatty-acyl-phospholipid synthase-like methyltransferase
MTNIYNDGTYLENNPTWHEHDAAWKVSQIRKMLRRNNVTPQRVCDIGCGTGEILRLLASGGPATAMYVGYDVSPQAHELATAKQTSNVRFHLGHVPSGEMPYDLITCIDVFEHVEDYFSLLRSLRGKAVHALFHIPLDLSVQTILRKGALLKRRTDIGHVHYFTKDTALATLRDSGYHILDYFYTHKFCDTNQVGIMNNAVKITQKALFAMHEELMARIIGCSSLMVLAK